MSSSVKRHRPAGSQGHRSPPPLSAPGTLLSEFRDGLESLFPPGRDKEIACPFVKHNPNGYRNVRNACTLTGYSKVGPWKEHIKRVHLLRYGCHGCNKRYICKEEQLAALKEDHECGGAPKARQESEVEITTEEQDKRFLELDFRSSGLNIEEAFKQSFLTLWPETPPADVPSGYMKPGFVFSMPDIEAVLEWIEQRRLRSAILDQSPVAMQAALPANMPELSAFPLISSLCTHWSCHQRFSFLGRCVADLDHFAGNITEREPYSVGSNCTAHVPQGPLLPVSSHDLWTQQHPDTSSYPRTVTQGKGSTDSGYNTRELNEQDAVSTAGPAPATSCQGAPEPNPTPLSQLWPYSDPELTYPVSYSPVVFIDEANEANEANGAAEAYEVGGAGELDFSHMGDLFE